MDDEADFVRDIIDRFVREVPDIPVETAYKIEREIRARWGGCQVYVARSDRRGQHAAIRKAWFSGVSIASMEDAFGIDRQMIYRLIRRK